MTFVELGFNALVFTYPTDLIAQAQIDCWQGISRACFLRERRNTQQHHVFTNLEGIQEAPLPLPVL